MLEKIKELAKAEGLELAEENAKDLVKVAVKIVDLAVNATETDLDNMVWAASKGKLEEFLLEKADEINPND